jgi:hypothetical protein
MIKQGQGRSGPRAREDEGDIAVTHGCCTVFCDSNSLIGRRLYLLSQRGPRSEWTALCIQGREGCAASRRWEPMGVSPFCRGRKNDSGRNPMQRVVSRRLVSRNLLGRCSRGTSNLYIYIYI